MHRDTCDVVTKWSRGSVALIAVAVLVLSHNSRQKVSFYSAIACSVELSSKNFQVNGLPIQHDYVPLSLEGCYVDHGEFACSYRLELPYFTANILDFIQVADKFLECSMIFQPSLLFSHCSVLNFL